MLCASLKLIVQVPAPTNETTPSDTVQVLVVLDVIETVSPEVAVALGV